MSNDRLNLKIVSGKIVSGNLKSKKWTSHQCNVKIENELWLEMLFFSPCRNLSMTVISIFFGAKLN